ncbi:MAG: hypothetical protein SGI71_11475 [Verrucomicrobiota bacterium]|nr:hypothetical protein [Verrucomicrobiota bacterium]
MIRPDGEVCARLVRSPDESGEDAMLLRIQVLDVNKLPSHVGSFHVVGLTIASIMFLIVGQSACSAATAETEERE